MAFRSVSLLAFIGAVGAITISLVAAFLAARAAEEGRASARFELQAQAEAAGHEASRFLDERLDTLQALAKAPALSDGRAETTQLLLDSLPGVSSFLAVSLLDNDGRLVAQSGGIPPGPPQSFMDRDFVQEVLRTGRPSVGTGVLGRIIQQPLVPFGVPLQDASGKTTGVLAASVSLSNEDALRFGLAPSISILGRQGRVVYDSSGMSAPLEEKAEWLAATLPADTQGVAAATGVHGTADSVIAFSRVPLSFGQWTVVVESPASELYGSADNRLREELAVLSRDIGDTADRREPPERGVASVVIVLVEPAVQRPRAGLF